MPNFGERLRKLRGDRSQKEVAKNIGIPQTTLSTFENQDSIPRGEVVQRFADFYKVLPNYFYKEDEQGLTSSAAAKAWIHSLKQPVTGKATIATQAGTQIDEVTKQRIAEALRKKYADSTNE